MSIGVCGFTQLPIPAKTACAAMLIVSSNGGMSRFPFDLYKPVTPLMRGTWQDGFAPLRINAKRNEQIGEHIGTPKINFAQAPLNHFWWIIREDALKLMESLPITDGKKGETVGDIVKDKRSKFVEKLEEAFELYKLSEDELNSRITAEDESAGRMFINRMTLTSSGLRQFMGHEFRYPEGQNSSALNIIYDGLEKVMKTGGSVTWDATPHIEDFFGILTVYNALMLSRRALFPHGEIGRRYDTDADVHHLIGSHIAGIASTMKKDEIEDDD